MPSYSTHEMKTILLHDHILSAIVPRPIALVSTVDLDGNDNLSPFSFYNAFGSNPSTLIFSPARRVRDNTIKHTLKNVIATRECVINAVTYTIVEQTSLSSVEYPAEISEFIKAGFTPIPSIKVAPKRVAESPVQFECKVRDIIATGDQGGAGNLVICEILMMHIHDDVLDEKGRIDQHKLDIVGRLGGDYYCRASGDALFTINKPNEKLSIGIDQLPINIRNSNKLTGYELAQLASVEAIPERDMNTIITSTQDEIYIIVKKLLSENQIALAWQYLLQNNER